MGYFDTKKFWFGTELYSKWIDTPVMGASVSPTGWSEGGTLLSGGGYQFNSSESHRLHTFEWRESSSYEAAQEMSDFANGAYGDGPIHFVLPTIYEKNILPPQWASPATMAASNPAFRGFGVTKRTVSDIVPQIYPSGTPYPRTLAQLSIPPGGARGESIFVPIPEGFDMHLGFMGIVTSSQGLYATPVSSDGTELSDVKVSTPLTSVDRILSELPVVTDVIPGAGLAGVRLWFAGSNTQPFDSNMYILSIIARLLPSGADVTRTQTTPWTGGMGNSGCRFAGKPTMNLHTGFDGGRASFAATLREVGSWLQ